MTRTHGAGSSHDDTGHRAEPVGGATRTWLHAWHEGYADAMTRCAQPLHGAQPPQWRTDVADTAGRPREVVVADADGRITVTPPPGAGFSLNPDQADLLALATQAASNRARRLASR